MTVITDPLADTDLAAIDPPEGLSGFGLGELFFILSLHPGPVTTTTRQWLFLEDKFATPEVALCGASSLLARGLLTTTADEDLQLRSSAALLEVATGRTVQWTRVGFIGVDTQPRAAFFLQTPVVSAVLQLDAMATWWCRFGDADDDPGAIIDALVASRFAMDPQGSVIVDTMNDTNVRRNILVRRLDDGFAALADVKRGGTGGRELEVPPDGLPALFSGLVGATA